MYSHTQCEHTALTNPTYLSSYTVRVYRSGQPQSRPYNLSITSQQALTDTTLPFVPYLFPWARHDLQLMECLTSLYLLAITYEHLTLTVQTEEQKTLASKSNNMLL
jgi:hypothetical protein